MINRFLPASVFLVAETQILNEGLNSFLAELGVPEWTTDAPTDAEKLMEVAGKLCYMSFSTDLNKNLTKTGGRSNLQYLQDGLIKVKHGSVLEHATVTFILLNVSRVLTHELVRHRAGCAYSQVSGRYVRTGVIYGSDLPEIIKKNPKAMEIFENAFKQMEDNVQKLSSVFKIDEMTSPKAFALKKILTSAFRRLVGNGQANHITFTANHRALRHILVERTSRHAEEEIRKVFLSVFSLLKTRYPNLYADMGLVYLTAAEKLEAPECQHDIPEVRSTGFNKV